jgi:hypothetical protein
MHKALGLERKDIHQTEESLGHYGAVMPVFSWSKKLVNQMKKDERWSEFIDKDVTIEPEQEVIQMERHVVGVEETEDSFIVEFRKADMEAAEDTC